MVLESLKDELEMNAEGDVMTFLGIQFNHFPGGEVEMQQVGLTERVLNTTGLQDCNSDRTPPAQQPLGSNKDGTPFAEQ